MTSATAAAAFLGHGNPMNTLEDNVYTRAWRAFGEATPRPRAVCVISAHWFIGATAVTAMERPRTIHDFYGFPQRLFDVEYPAPGAPDVAQEIADAVRPRWVGLDRDSWGLDHGTWTVLRHVYPDADVPIVQLSINATHPFDHHLDLGARLAPLRERGIAIIASGNVVHNLRAVAPKTHREQGFDWAERFDEKAREILTTRPGDVLELTSHPDYAMAVPTPDHFIPLIYLAAVADRANARPEVLTPGYAWGSLSMTSYAIGCACEPDETGARPSVRPPDGVPPEETNT